MRDHFVGVRLPSELVERAKERAKQDQRSLSNYIHSLIERDLADDDAGGATIHDALSLTPLPPPKAVRYSRKKKSA